MFNISSLLQHPQSSSVFFIAELGINHDGNLSIVKKMIDAAIEAKADAVKFQLYDPDLFYNKSVAPEAYQLFKSFYISFDDFILMRDYADSKGILAFATPLDYKMLNKLMNYPIYPIKIASGDALTEPWLDLLLEKNIPVIISTGSMNDEEISVLAQKISGTQSALLYCVSDYPAIPESFDIRYLQKMQKYIPQQAVGFSDHSRGIALSLAAVAMGAKIVERHFTLFPDRMDLDHPVSLCTEMFYKLVSSSRIIEKALGKGDRQITRGEQKNRSLSGRDAFAKVIIPKNTIITEDMIILQRPGSGISSQIYQTLIGQSHKEDIPQGTRLLNIFPECIS